MDDRLILVRVPSTQDFIELADKIRNNNIHCSIMLLEHKIYTKNLIIKCIVIPYGRKNVNYTRGLRAKGCFGFDDESTYYITRNSKNICDGYGLMEYILEKNKEEC